MGKTLYVIGLEGELTEWLESTSAYQQGDIVLRCVGPEIAHPFDGLMRTIVLATYQEQVEKVIVVGHARQQELCDLDEAMDSLEPRKLDLLNYLFKTHAVGFGSNSLIDWLYGTSSVQRRVNVTLDIIQKHPLMPKHVTIEGMVIK